MTDYAHFRGLAAQQKTRLGKRLGGRSLRARREPRNAGCELCTAKQLFPSTARFTALDSGNRGAIQPRLSRCLSALEPRHARQLRGSLQASHFRRKFIMTQVDHNRMANAIRGLAMDAVEKAKSGHPGLPMGAADIATVLFTQFLKFDAADPKWPDRDRFVLSAGHGSMLLYALLYLTGNVDMTLDQIKNFRQLGSKTPGHPENFDTKRRRDHHRPARPGHRDLGRHGAGGKDAGCRVRQEDRRPPHLCARLRRRPDGRHLAGSDRDGRALEAQQADRAL